MPPRSTAPSPTPSLLKKPPPLIRFSNSSKSSKSSSQQLEHKLSQSLPPHASAGKFGSDKEVRFLKMSGRTRTKREELELDSIQAGEGDLEVDDVEEEEDEEEEEEEEEEDSASKGKQKGKGKVKEGVKEKEKEKEKNLNKRNSGSVGRRKIAMSFIEEKNRRTVTFTKRKSGLMKKAFELSTLTGTDCLVVVVSESGLVYTFATPSLKGVVESNRGKEVIGLALKGELPVEDEEEDETREGGGGDGRKKSAGKKGGKGKGKEKDGKEKSQTPTALDLNAERERERNELFLGMGIDPSLGGGGETSNQHYSLGSTSTSTLTTSTTTDPYAAFTLPDHDSSNHFSLPNPPILSNSASSSASSYPHQHHHQDLLPIPPLLTPLPLTSTSSQTQGGYDPSSLYHAHSFYYHPPPQTDHQPPTSNQSQPFPSLVAPSTTNFPSTSQIIQPGGGGVVVDFERASKEHELAFENYERRFNASLLLGQTPVPPPLEEDDQEEEEDETRFTRSSLSTSAEALMGSVSESRLGKRRRTESQGLAGEDDLYDGFERRKSLKLGMKDFGPLLLDWNDKVKKGSFHPQVQPQSASLAIPTSTRIETASAEEEEEEQGLVEKKEKGVSVEERRKFWKDKSQIMIRLARSTPTLLNFFQASMLSQFSLLPLPPSISLNNGSQEIVIPVQGSKDWCMMELNRFVAGYEGLSELSLKDGEGEGVLEGVIEGFLLDQSQRGGEGKGLNTIKHHLVGWFDWLEGHELIDEDTHGRLCGFESGEGDGEGKWEEVRKKFETK